MDEGPLVRKFIAADLQLTQDGLDKLRGSKDADVSADLVLTALKESQSRPFLITAEVISRILEGGQEKPPQAAPVQVVPQPPAPEAPPQPVAVERRPMGLSHTKFKPLAAEYEPKIKVLKDVTGQSYSEGELSNFVGLFRDRYERLNSMMRKRVDFNDAVGVGSLRNMLDKQMVKVVGMVREKRESSAGNVMIELEDLTGTTSAFVFSGNKDLLKKAGEVNNDEVVGVVGSLRADGRSPRIFVKDIIWPDLPIRHDVHRAEDPLCAVLLSDIHIGSAKFCEDAFARFLRWLRGESGYKDELAGRVKYVVIAGDTVDGIGVYPYQEEELLIKDIFKQYDAAAKLLSQIPDYIKIIIAPGNHDAVRPAEPQPAIQKDVAPALYDLGAMMIGNPARLTLSDVEFLVYHGRSFDDLISSIPGLNREHTTPPMVKMLKKRHLAPIYGGRTAISPEKSDYMVIENIPDVFHAGHLHIFGYERYRDIEVINSGTFQAMTNFMRQLGVKPTPGYVPIVDLQTHNVEVENFA